MNNSDFLIWLQGFLEGQNIVLTGEQVDRIREKLPSKYQIDISRLPVEKTSVNQSITDRMLKTPLEKANEFADLIFPKELIQDNRFLYNPAINDKDNTNDEARIC